MSESTKKHVYPYTLRICALAGTSSGVLCGDSAFMFITPPENALTIEGLFVHLKLTFDAGIASGNRVLQWLAISNDVPLAPGGTPTFFRKIDLNQSADASRKIDVKLDLSTCLNNDGVGFINSDSSITGTPTYVMLKVADANRGVTTVANIDLWKIEAKYTTKGIR